MDCLPENRKLKLCSSMLAEVIFKGWLMSNAYLHFDDEEKLLLDLSLKFAWP
jgi:hypothetical protein